MTLKRFLTGIILASLVAMTIHDCRAWDNIDRALFASPQKTHICAATRPANERRQNSEPPFIRRFLFFLVSLLCGLFGIFLGGEAYYNKRRLFGAALMFGSGALAVFGLFLWFVTQFPSTWDWLL